jgi:hypothetical protein
VTWALAGEIVRTTAAVLAIVGALVALATFRRAARTRRAEWLASLHEKFFETERHRRIRRVLDYRPEPEYTQVRQAVASGQHHDLADELYGYLNFFELLGSLRALRQISDREIVALFEYDLALLRQHPFILDALAPQGFEHLAALLSRLPLKRLG